MPQLLKYLLHFAIYLCVSINSYAAENFITFTDKTEFAKGEYITITAQLNNIKALDNPDISKFYDAGFSLVKKQQNTKTSIINGKKNSSKSWVYSFKTDFSGNLILPSISIKSKKGKLSSKEIPIFISKEPIKPQVSGQEIYIESNVETNNPFINQNIIYSFSITRFINIRKAEITPPSAKDAIIQEIFQPQEEELIIKGRNAIKTTYYYLIIPIKTGEITITAPELRGLVIDRDNSYADPFNFGNIAQFASLHQYKEFNLLGKNLTLNVLQAKYKQADWLPLKKLNIATEFTKTDIELGDALSLSVTLSGENIDGKQLPNITIPEIENAKIYPETPQTNMEFNFAKKEIIGSKIMKFTIIPAKSGNITIEPFKIAWWDVTQNKLRYATTKKFNFNVKSNPNNPRPNININNNIADTLPITQNENLNWSYILNVILGLFLMILLISHFKLKRNLHSNNDITAKKPQISLLNSTSNAQDLHDFCLKYFKNNFAISAHNLNDILSALETKIPNELQNLITNIFGQLNAALYGKQPFNPKLKKQLYKIIKKIPKKAFKNSSSQNNFKLNPF